MATKKIYMTGDELIKKLLVNERDLRKVKLEKINLNQREDFSELQNYLRNQDFEKNPIDISNSNFSHIKARGLWMPYLIGKQSNFYKADFSDANFYKANLEESYFAEANLYRIFLMEANLNKSSFIFANLEEANLERASIIDVEQFGFVHGIETIKFYETRIHETLKKSLESVLKIKPLFSVVDK